jgi:hypothetical protein
MNNELDGEDQAFAQAMARKLRASENVDRDTAARLAVARRRAVANAASRSPWHWSLPIGAFATGVLALAMTLYPRQAAEPAADAHVVDALDLLTDDKGPEFYRDLEFYRWLDQEHPHA